MTHKLLTVILATLAFPATAITINCNTPTTKSIRINFGPTGYNWWWTGINIHIKHQNLSPWYTGTQTPNGLGGYYTEYNVGKVTVNGQTGCNGLWAPADNREYCIPFRILSYHGADGLTYLIGGNSSDSKYYHYNIRPQTITINFASADTLGGLPSPVTVSATIRGNPNTVSATYAISTSLTTGNYTAAQTIDNKEFAYGSLSAATRTPDLLFKNTSPNIITISGMPSSILPCTTAASSSCKQSGDRMVRPGESYYTKYAPTSPSSVTATATATMHCK